MAGHLFLDMLNSVALGIVDVQMQMQRGTADIPAAWLAGETKEESRDLGSVLL
jgi:hypothetical protein